MGKVFSENKSKLIPLFILIFALLYPTGVSATGREYELFDNAYENYIAYRPERAVEEFRTFLEEFPRSSAKDAAMFWLGRSLVRRESLEEANQVFSNLIIEFPESPFRKYAEKEIEMINKIPPPDKSVSPSDGGDEKESSVPQGMTEGAKTEELKAEELKTEEVKTDGAESSVKKPLEDDSAVKKDELRPLFEEEKLKTVKLQDGEEEVEKKEAYLANASFVLNKLSVTYVAWKGGDILKDIENEQLLYEKAKSLNISADREMYQDLVEKYHFNSEQAEYLHKFLTICELVDMRLRDRQGGRVVESLVVRYEEGDRYKKITSSTELQRQAKSGMSFEDIFRMHPDIVEFKTSRFQDLDEWIKEKIFYLENNEIGVIWSEEGYMLLKPVVKRISCNPAEAMKPGMKERIKSSVGELLQEIKGQDNSGTEKKANIVLIPQS